MGEGRLSNAESGLSGHANIADVFSICFTAAMQKLENLLRKYACETDARWWIGNRPDCAKEESPKNIARNVGLPTSRHNFIENEGMTFLDKAEAAFVLALAGTQSLAYETKPPTREAVLDAIAALNDLDDNAIFLTNGSWARMGFGWNPLTTATFDCGVIGFDEARAFIFWIEEED